MSTAAHDVENFLVHLGFERSRHGIEWHTDHGAIGLTLAPYSDDERETSEECEVGLYFLPPTQLADAPVLRLPSYAPLVRSVVGIARGRHTTTVRTPRASMYAQARLTGLADSIRDLACTTSIEWIATRVSTRDRCLSPHHLLDTAWLIHSLFHAGKRPLAAQIYQDYVSHAQSHLLAPPDEHLRATQDIFTACNFAPLTRASYATQDSRTIAPETFRFFTLDPRPDAEPTEIESFKLPTEVPSRDIVVSVLGAGHGLINATTLTPYLFGDEVHGFFMETPLLRTPCASLRHAAFALDHFGVRQALINEADSDDFLILVDGDAGQATRDVHISYRIGSGAFNAAIHDWATGNITEVDGDKRAMLRLIDDFIQQRQ